MRKALLILIVFSPLLYLSAQQYTKGSPEWLVDMFFNSGGFPQKAEYYTGEMINDANQPTIGEEISDDDAQVLFFKIDEADNEQTFAVELELNEQVIDFYVYLQVAKDRWKINAVRRFLLPGFIYEALDSLTNLSSSSASDLNLVKTLELFTMNDARLKNYLGASVDDFYNVVWYFNQKENEEVNKGLRNLGCNAIFKDNRFSNCVFIQISSFDRMEAGFIYATDTSSLPSISPSEFIYLEEVLPGWFIYRIM